MARMVMAPNESSRVHFSYGLTVTMGIETKVHIKRGYNAAAPTKRLYFRKQLFEPHPKGCCVLQNKFSPFV